MNCRYILKEDVPYYSIRDVEYAERDITFAVSLSHTNIDYPYIKVYVSFIDVYEDDPYSVVSTRIERMDVLAILSLEAERYFERVSTQIVEPILKSFIKQLEKHAV